MQLTHCEFVPNSNIPMNFLSVPFGGKPTQKGASIMDLKNNNTTKTTKKHHKKNLHTPLFFFFKLLARWFRFGLKSISYVLLNQAASEEPKIELHRSAPSSTQNGAPSPLPRLPQRLMAPDGWGVADEVNEVSGQRGGSWKPCLTHGFVLKSGIKKGEKERKHTSSVAFSQQSRGRVVGFEYVCWKDNLFLILPHHPPKSVLYKWWSSAFHWPFGSS